MATATIDILLYHDVCSSDEEVRSRSNPIYTTPLPKLQFHLDWLSHSGFRAVRLCDWIDAQADERLWQGKHVLLTFDGPHTGWFEHVIPLLVRRQLPATFFVTAGWVGAEHLYPESRHLTWDDIVEIERLTDRSGRQLFDVGCHAMWHTVLEKQSSESESAYRQRLDEEIIEACSLIREQTGFSVKAYAPPKGRGNLASLRPVFESAELASVRWASLPGEQNQYHRDLFDLQISYCDTMPQSFDQLGVLLSARRPPHLFSRLRQGLISRLNQVSK
jgi:peptidoglycan/xylan/chitin deacetylase (PgdA/CDA1 family)